MEDLAGAPVPDRELARAETLARWLDDRMLDPLLGLVLPGAGDALGALLGAYLVVIALRRKLPAVIVARMLLNLAVDALVGAIPVAGDLFDVLFRANRMNVALLKARALERRARTSDWLLIGAAAALALAAVALPVALVVWIALRLFRH